MGRFGFTVAALSVVAVVSSRPALAGRWLDGTYDVSLCPRSGSASYRCGRIFAPDNALSVCGDLLAGDALIVEKRRNAALADVNVAGATLSMGTMTIAGGFFSAGAVDTRGAVHIGGDVIVGDNMRTLKPVSVDGNVFVRGVLYAGDSVSIAGALALFNMLTAGTVSAASTQFLVTAPPLPPPCAASAAVATFVADATAHPDKSADAALADDVFDGDALPDDLTIGCGTFRMSGAQASRAQIVRIVGATALIVDGDMTISAPLRVRLADGASLEVVVGGALRIDSPTEIGDAAHPVWLAVAGGIALSAPATLTGALYAPHSTVDSHARLEVLGAAYVGAVRASAPLIIRDRAARFASACR